MKKWHNFILKEQRVICLYSLKSLFFLLDNDDNTHFFDLFR